MLHQPHNLQHCGRSLRSLLLSLPAILPAAADPVARVGRVARTAGPAFLSRAAGRGAEPATGNWPLQGGDLLSTGAGGRAEVEIGSTLLQLDADSVLAFVRVDDQQLALRLRAGSLIARCRSLEMARQFAIECGGLRFGLCDAGRYRLTVGCDSVAATATEGALRYSVGDRSRVIDAGKTLCLSGNGDAEHESLAAIDDEFARWSLARESSSGAADGFRHVSPELTGAGDLASHGDWYETPAYGAVWFPRNLPADWAPYRSGSWAWLEPWGWTWIGREPWAFAPFHYGRWACFRGAWGWLPGLRVQRPVYAPALVAWSDPVEAGRPPCSGQPAAAWRPLEPREAYAPTYRCSSRYLRQLNAPQAGNTEQLSEVGRELLAMTSGRAAGRAPRDDRVLAP
ncbi:MAG: hypothetical protein JNN21_08030 [Candidatus Accumulibacter sp.]|mgnify:FL=1|uniref:DUF6600 domain-containing protein n=1 Tax=Accumulibacter sp. TaxID=2053492 RepID=UPI001A43571A|nr:DUF6600 domain-containing protein [Accumulibacter sp.]MBL8391809.1 hypothetical protein [Accumulibacter sp.]HRD89094.1 hypothetical protein [Accumulibacter sp.]